MNAQRGWHYRHGLLWMADLSEPADSAPAPRLPVEFREITPATCRDLLAAVAEVDSISPRAIQQRLDTGRRCIAVWIDGCIAAYSWLTHGPEWVGEFHRELCVEADEAYIWDCVTLPNYRRQRLFTGLLAHVRRVMEMEALKRLWIIGLYGPDAILKRIESAGFTPVMQLRYLQLSQHAMFLKTPFSQASSSQVKAADRLLTPQTETRLGPLCLGRLDEALVPESHRLTS